jgi:predicted nicotinamide N-methyase
MGFFDFLRNLPAYDDTPGAARRLNLRHAALIAPFAADLAGARVVDLGAHDGRWSYALAAAGAAEVVAVEPRAELLARLPQFPNPAWRARIRPVQAEAIDHLETALRAGERFDFAAVFGLFYHIMDHNRLLLLLRRLGARLIVIDGEFLQPANPMIQMVREATAKPLNAAPQFPGQAMTFKGVPSIGAIQAMAEALEYDLDWFPWDALPPADRGPVGDYFRPGRMRRATCVLRRRAGPDQDPARESHASSQ